MGRRVFTLDWVVFATIVVLTTLGLVTQLSISSLYFYQQLIYGVLGVGLFFIFSRIDFGIYAYLTKFILMGSILFLLLSYLGPNVRGATRWLELGVVRIQPSEFVKPFFILGLSSLIISFPLTKLRHILMHSGVFLIFFFLVFRQPDLGNGIIYMAMWLGLMIVGGVPIRYLLGGILSVILLGPTIYNLLHEYQRLRIITLLSPEIDPQGAGYNALQSMISVGSGQLLGRGFGRGTQSLLQFLPERHTDFIFATFAEEFGFLGAGILLLLIFILLYRMLKQAEKLNSEDVAHLFIVGLFIQISVHVIINVGMNLGILPVTGITLPFVSYGGSSLLATYMSFGIYMSALRYARV